LSPENQNTQVSSPGSSVAELFAGYKGGEDMPLAGYATLLGIYNTAFAALLLTAKNSGRHLPERVSYADLVLLGLATHKISRIIAKDRVTSPLRAPFTEYEEPAGESEVKEKVRGQGLQRAIGDLVTCHWCLGAWVAAGLTFGLVFRPRTTRIVGTVFAAVVVSEFLNYAQEAAKEKSR